MHVISPPSTRESPFSPTPTFDTSLPVLPVSLPPLLSSALEPIVPISTPTIPIFDIPRPLQSQVIDANLSTLLIMAYLDTPQELFVSMDSLIDPHLCRTETQMDDLTFSVQQLTSLVVPPK